MIEGKFQELLKGDTVINLRFQFETGINMKGWSSMGSCEKVSLSMLRREGSRRPIFKTALLDEVIEKKRKSQEDLRLDMIKKILTAIDRLSGELSFEEAYLFGSITKPFRFSERSDVDIAFVGLDNRHFFKLMSYISKEAGIDVDIVQLEDHKLADNIKKRGIRWRRKD